MRIAPRFRKIFDRLRYTPLHPQWFAYRNERLRLQTTARLATGDTLDVGCGRQSLRAYLDERCNYLSLDTPGTGKRLYGAQPDIFGKAQKLPVKQEQFDTIVILEVLEHLEEPQAALHEAMRALRPGGKIIISTPFLYPIHDAPWDFQRWTSYGLEQLAQSAKADIKELKPIGSTIETGCLIFNLSLLWHTMNAHWLMRIPLILLAAALVPTTNLLARALHMAGNTQNDGRFANSYLMILEKGSTTND